MKKITLFASTFILLFGMTNLATAKTFTNVSGGTAATTILGGATFSTSTNVELAALASTTSWAAVSKHISGGTSSYGLVSSDTNITITKDLAPAVGVTAPKSATSLK